MRVELLRVEYEGPGRLATMARPGGGNWLADELAALVADGVGVLVSLLSDDETAELELQDQPAPAFFWGLDFHRLPTPDLTAPDRARVWALAAQLRDRLRHSASIVVHCRAGIGRSSTLAAAVLVLDGLSPADAWHRISTARGLPVPETDGQRDFVAGLALRNVSARDQV